MQFARTTGPFLEHELVDPVDAAGRRLLDDAVLGDAVDAGHDRAETPAADVDRDATPAPGGAEH